MKFSVYSCAILSLLFAVLFTLDLLGYFTPVRHPIASLIDGMGTIRRLSANELSWDRASIGMLFSKRDAVATGEQSWARIAFDAGGELELDSGTLVVLADHPEALKLQFISGTGKVRIGKRMKKKIKVTQLPAPTRQEFKKNTGVPPQQSRVQELEALEHPGREIEISPGTKGPVEFEVLDETAMPPQEAKRLRNEGLKTNQKFAQAIRLLSEEAARVPIARTAKLGSLTLKETPPVPQIIFPKDGEVLDLDQKQMPYLKWQTKTSDSQKPEGYEVLIRAADLTASTVIVDAKKPWIKLSPKLFKKSGKYLWAVRSVNKLGKKSPVSTYNWFEVDKIKVATHKTQKPESKKTFHPPKLPKRTFKKIKRKPRPPRIKQSPEVYPVIID